MKKIISAVLAIIPYCIVFIASLYTPVDPDLGWHLKYGQYFILHHAILRTNTFSTLMPLYHWANVSWVTDVLTYLIYASSGFLGLTIASSLIVTLTFLFFAKAARLTFWEETFLFPLLLFLETPVNAVSFRGQQITLLFLGVLFYLISRYKSSPRLLYLTIPLFFLWVNISGEFLLGTAVFFGWMSIYIAQLCITRIMDTNKRTYTDMIRAGIQEFIKKDRRETLLLIGIFFAGVIATFINPFGIGVHMDALIHIHNPALKDIAEYLPFDPLSQPWWNEVIIAVLICIGIIFLYFSETLSDSLPMVGVMIVLFLLSYEVRRYAWPAYYLTLPILTPLPRFFKPDTKLFTNIVAGFFLLVVLISVFFIKSPLMQFTNFNWDTYCISSYLDCSPQSAQFLIDNHLTQNVFSLYGWGGWLIWNYPQIKPVIDGRMDTWVDSNGYSAFSFYYPLEQNEASIQNTKYKIVYMIPSKPLYTQMINLVRAGKWRLVYHDQYAGIFVRN